MLVTTRNFFAINIISFVTFDVTCVDLWVLFSNSQEYDQKSEQGDPKDDNSSAQWTLP